MKTDYLEHSGFIARKTLSPLHENYASKVQRSNKSLSSKKIVVHIPSVEAETNENAENPGNPGSLGKSDKNTNFRGKVLPRVGKVSKSPVCLGQNPGFFSPVIACETVNSFYNKDLVFFRNKIFLQLEKHEEGPGRKLSIVQMPLPTGRNTETKLPRTLSRLKFRDKNLKRLHIENA